MKQPKITNIDDALAALEALILFFGAREYAYQSERSTKISDALRRIMNYARVL